VYPTDTRGQITTELGSRTLESFPDSGNRLSKTECKGARMGPK